MTKDKSILIKNIYYMLSYAFQVLKQSTYDEISGEEFDDIKDLFAAILAKGMARQLKQGLYRSYVMKSEDLCTLRGKLDIGGTIHNHLQRKHVLSCEYDELSENNLFNQILKTTAYLLMKADGVDSKQRNDLNKVLVFFGNIQMIDPFSIQWNRLSYQRNNRNYELLLNICYFVLAGMLQTTESGEYKMASFSDEYMSKLYEKFVLEYYAEHHTYLSEVKAAKVKWDLDIDADEGMIKFLPEMQTDIFLRLGEKVLIIDAKYYSQSLQKQYDKLSLHSGNVYQIFTYVKNQDAQQTGNVGGLLLYARTDEEIVPDGMVKMGKNWIGAKTLDLNMEFKDIARQLDLIVNDFFYKKLAT